MPSPRIPLAIDKFSLPTLHNVPAEGDRKNLLAKAKLVYSGLHFWAGHRFRERQIVRPGWFEQSDRRHRILRLLPGPRLLPPASAVAFFFMKKQHILNAVGGH
jgi:hypothetical protein